MLKGDRLKVVCLVDAFGALGSALGMLVIFLLPQVSTGVPKPAAVLFAVAALCLAFNSFRTWRSKPQIKGRNVVLIGLLNLAYCSATAVFVAVLTQSLQPLVLAYFAIELVIVIPLAVFEISIGRAAMSAES